jgi:hypothetical protein
MDSYNPSIFIRLPRLPGTKWVPADIVDVLDKYGDIKEVSIHNDSYGGQFAVVHFNEWYDHKGAIMNAVNKCKPVRVRALYRKYFNLILFQVKRPEVKRPEGTYGPKAYIIPNLPVAPGISFGNPGQLSALEFLEQKKQNENAASTFIQMINKHNDNLVDILMRRHRSDSGVLQRHRSDSGVSDITMEDNFEGTAPHYYRHYQLEEGEII